MSKQKRVINGWVSANFNIKDFMGWDGFHGSMFKHLALRPFRPIYAMRGRKSQVKRCWGKSPPRRIKITIEVRDEKP